MYCNNCGFNNGGAFEFCPNCGAAASYGAQYQSVTNEETAYTDYAEPAPYSDGLGMASMICGIVAMLCCNIIGIPSIVALILGIVASSKAKKAGTKSGFSIAGIVLGAIGCVFALLGLVVTVIYFVLFGGTAFAAIMSSM